MTAHRHPDESWQNDYSRRGMNWVHDSLVNLMGRDAFFPGSTATVLELGWKLSDVNRIYDEAKNGRMAIDTTAQLGYHHLEEAREKEAAGLDRTALEYYHRAALCFMKAQWSVLDADDPEKREWHARGSEAYERVMALNPDYEMERVDVDLPFHDERLPAIFHRCGEEPAPTILNVPGMDLTKEEIPNPLDNPFVHRGMNVLSIDGPGQGEARIRGICDDEYDRYQRAGSAAIDWLVDRPEVDSDRIGVFGVSAGSYWGPRIAYEDDRVDVLAVAEGSFYSKDVLFNQAMPNFKRRYMYMAGMTDEDEFDEFARDMTLHGIDEEIDVPTFIAHGEYDELQTREQAKLFYERLPGPKHLQLYENEFHPLGGYFPDVLCDVGDWFQNVWGGRIDDDYERAVYVPDYPTESYVPSPKFDFLDTSEGGAR